MQAMWLPLDDWLPVALVLDQPDLLCRLLVDLVNELQGLKGW